MKLRLITILLALLILLSACTATPAGGAETTGAQTTEEPAETTDGTTTDGETSGAPDSGASDTTTGGDETKPPEPPEKEQILLPLPYIDIEFAAGEEPYDRMNRVVCTVADPSRGNVVNEALSFMGESYTVPHFCVKSAGGVLRLTYRNLENMYDLYADLMGGITMEAFLVNFDKTDASSGEQCMIASTQSGGYNFTVLKGNYTASIHTDGSYHNAHLSGGYDNLQLTHLIGVYDPVSETIKLYVNGRCVQSTDAPGLLGLATGECFRNIIIGGDINSDGSTNIHCNSLAVVDFKMYRTPLSSEQAKGVYARAVSALTGAECEYDVVEGESQIGITDALFDSYYDSFATELYQPDTKLENPPTVLTYASGTTNTLAGASVRPATVLFDISMKYGVLHATDAKGNDLGTLFEAIRSLQKKMIPAFRISDEAPWKALAAFIDDNNIGDCFLISDDADLLRTVADSTYSARPLLDCTALTAIDADAIFLKAAAAGVKTVLLSAECLSAEAMLPLRARSVNVVAVLREGADVGAIHNAVHSAVSGILTADADAVYDYYKTVKDRTLCITPLMVAHRGDPENHPDNMLRSLISAGQSGATSIELDVWLTKDGHLVLNHDSKTTEFNQQLNCKESTRAQLEALTYTGKHAEAGDKIAFLDEVFALFSKEYTDKILTIEVKDAREVTIDAIVKLAKEYKMTSRIILIGMNHLVSRYTYEKYGLGHNMNQSYLVKKADPASSLILGVIESTMLHSACFTQHKEEHPDFMRGICPRLIKYSTWTSKTYDATMKNYLCGAVEYTSNFPHAIDDFYRYLQVSLSDSGSVSVEAVTYAGETVIITGLAELVVLEGSVTYSGGRISGSGTFAFRVQCAVPTVSGSTYYLYTPAVTLKG